MAGMANMNAVRASEMQDDVVMALGLLNDGAEESGEKDPLLPALADLIATAGLANILQTIRDAAQYAADADRDPGLAKLAKSLESAISIANGAK